MSLRVHTLHVTVLSLGNDGAQASSGSGSYATAGAFCALMDCAGTVSPIVMSSKSQKARSEALGPGNHGLRRPQDALRKVQSSRVLIRSSGLRF